MPEYAIAKPFKADIMSFKKSLVIKNNKIDSQQTVAKTSIFDVPTQFWQSGFDSFFFKEYPHASIKFTDFAKNRENFEYIKEFNKLNSYQPTY